MVQITDTNPTLVTLPADRSRAAFLRQQRGVLGRRNAVTAPELSAPKRRVIGVLAGLTGGTSLFADRLLVGLVIGAVALFDLLPVCIVIGLVALFVLLLVGLVIGTLPRIVLGAVVRVLRALLAAPGVARVPLFCVERHSVCPIEVPASARPGGRRHDAAARVAARRRCQIEAERGGRLTPRGRRSLAAVVTPPDDLMMIAADEVPPPPTHFGLVPETYPPNVT